VTDKPRGTRLISDAQNDAVKENSQVTFYCTAESVPPPELELRFDDSPLGFFNNGRFTHKQLNASNQGSYGCVPRNILGIGPEATLHLTVLGKCLAHNGWTCCSESRQRLDLLVRLVSYVSRSCIRTLLLPNLKSFIPFIHKDNMPTFNIKNDLYQCTVHFLAITPRIGVMFSRGANRKCYWREKPKMIL